MSITVKDLHWSAGRRPIVRGVSLSVAEGETFGLLGPNGSGKSSILRVMAGLRAPSSGRVAIGGASLSRLSARAMAQRIAVVAQHATTETAVSVVDVVRLGRTPHHGILSAWTAQDDDIVSAAMAEVGLSAHRDQLWNTLSGGERQRVQLARALAQKPTHLLLDEPTNHLDVQHQIEILSLVSRLNLTTVVALHDLNLAARFCDRVGVLQDGQLVACGPPAEVLTRDLIARVFCVAAEVAPSVHHGRPHVQFVMSETR